MPVGLGNYTPEREDVDFERSRIESNVLTVRGDEAMLAVAERFT